MEALIDIPFELDTTSILKAVHVERNSPDGKMVRDLIARPKALYKEAFIETRGAESVMIDGVTFTIRMLRANLDRGAS